MIPNTDLRFLALIMAMCKSMKEKKMSRRWSNVWYKLRSCFTQNNLPNVLRNTESKENRE